MPQSEPRNRADFSARSQSRYSGTRDLSKDPDQIPMSPFQSIPRLVPRIPDWPRLGLKRANESLTNRGKGEILEGVRKRRKFLRCCRQDGKDQLMLLDWRLWEEGEEMEEGEREEGEREEGEMEEGEMEEGERKEEDWLVEAVERRVCGTD